MAILTPVNITHNNPTLPTVYFSDVKCNVWTTGSDGNQYGIPEGKRELGMVVYFSSSQDFKYYKGGSTSSADWSSPLSWSMFGGGATYLPGPGINIDANNYISDRLGNGLEFNGTNIQAALGDGLEFNGTNIQAEVRTVNGNLPINGNISTSLTAVLTGPSASSAPNNLIGSSSGDATGSIANATVWIVSGDSSTPDPDGLAYIFISQSATAGGAGEWLPLSYIDQNAADLRYVRLKPGNPSTVQYITSSLNITGSNITFSSSLYWLSGSHGANSPGALITASVIVLGNDGKLYITGAYGGGGGTNVKAGSVAPSAFSGTPLSSTITFNTVMSDANYGVSVIGGDARSWTIDSKNASGFTINTNSTVALTTSASWMASPSNNP